MWNDALPRNGITNWSVFYAAKTNLTDTQSWMKPAGCSWIYILSITSGTGGGRPANGATTVGGGGGSSGSIDRMLIPATVLPDIIYVKVGPGGAGATTANAGGAAGFRSYITITPDGPTRGQAQNYVYIGGFGGGGQGTGAGGSATPAITSASGIWLNIGLFTSIAGQAGAAGAASANANGSNITFGASGVFITGGAGGGNGTGNGGDITGAGLLPTITGGAGTNGANGNNGFRQGQILAPGFKLFPLLFSGGSGGGGHSTGTAGNGGNGSYGCGGGGGGAASGAGGVSGNGGNGGDGLILIGAF